MTGRDVIGPRCGDTMIGATGTPREKTRTTIYTGSSAIDRDCAVSGSNRLARKRGGSVIDTTVMVFDPPVTLSGTRGALTRTKSSVSRTPVNSTEEKFPIASATVAVDGTIVPLGGTTRTLHRKKCSIDGTQVAVRGRIFLSADRIVRASDERFTSAKQPVRSMERVAG